MSIALAIVVAFLFGASIGEGMEQKNVEISKPAIEISVEVSKIEVGIDGFVLEEVLSNPAAVTLKGINESTEEKASSR